MLHASHVQGVDHCLGGTWVKQQHGVHVLQAQGQLSFQKYKAHSMLLPQIWGHRLSTHGVHDVDSICCLTGVALRNPHALLRCLHCCWCCSIEHSTAVGCIAALKGLGARSGGCTKIRVLGRQDCPPQNCVTCTIGIHSKQSTQQMRREHALKGVADR
jgi:hypothetical protein